MLCPSSPVLQAELRSIDAKDYSGWVQSPTPIAPGLPACQMVYNTSAANLNKEKAALSIGRCSSVSLPKSLSARFVEHGLPSLDIGNSPVALPPRNMSGSLTHELENPLSLEYDDSDVIPPPTGLLCGRMQSLETSTIFPRTYLYDITVTSSRFALQVYSRLLWSDLVKSTGAELLLESHTAPGMKPASTLTLKIRVRNFGMVTQIKDMLLWMSFEELSTFVIFLDGSTGTRSEWKSRVPPFLSHAPSSGSLRTCPRQLGIRTWMQQRMQHSNED